jgi:hypothetical protein
VAAQDQKVEFLFAAQVSGQEQLKKLTDAVDSLRKEMEALKAANGGVGAATQQFSKSIGNASSHVQAYQKHLDAQAKAMRNHRQGTQQLGMQFNDLGTSISTGASPIQAFNQQLGQMGYAMSMMKGKAGEVGAFLAGPWGAAIVLATMALGFLAEGFLKSGDAANSSGKSIEKLVEEKRKSAIASENADKADEAFSRTLEGVLAAIKANKKAMEGLNAVKKTSAQLSLEDAKQALNSARMKQIETLVMITQARARLRDAMIRASQPGQANEMSSLGLGALGENIKDIADQYDEAAKVVKLAAGDFAKAQAYVSVERGQRTAEDSINKRYDAQIDGARRAAISSGAVGMALESEVAAIEKARNAELDRLADSERAGSRAESAAKRLANARERELNQANQIAEKIRDMVLVYGAANKEVGTTAKKLDDFNDMVQKLGTLNGGPALLQQLAGGIELVRNAIVSEGANKAFAEFNAEMDKLLAKDLTPFEQSISSLTEKVRNPELGGLDPEAIAKYYSALNSAAGKFFDDAIKSELDLFGKAVGVDDAFQMQVASLEQIIASMTAANIPVDELKAKLEQLLSINKTTAMIEKNKELQDSFKAIGESVSDAFKGMLTGASSWREGMRSLIGSVIDQLWKLFVVQKIVGFISGALGGTSSMPGNMGSAGDALKLIQVPGFAGGTMNAPGGMALVGERGPELVNLPRGSQVIPNHKLGRSGGGSRISVNVDARGSNDPAAVRAQVQQGIIEAAPAIIAAAESRTIAGLRRPRLGGAMQ